MSANRDRNQRATFVYSNLYQLYKKNPEAPVAPQTPAELPGQTGTVLKCGDRRVVANYQPMTLIARKAEAARELAPTLASTAEAIEAPAPEANGLSSLKENLKTLNDLHARLRFMLKELEELVKE